MDKKNRSPTLQGLQDAEPSQSFAEGPDDPSAPASQLINLNTKVKEIF